MAKWWVNDPNGASVHYPTKGQAKNVARQVQGATVSKGTAKGGKHKGGCLSPIIMVILAVVAILLV